MEIIGLPEPFERIGAVMRSALCVSACHLHKVKLYQRFVNDLPVQRYANRNGNGINNIAN